MIYICMKEGKINEVINEKTGQNIQFTVVENEDYIQVEQ